MRKYTDHIEMASRRPKGGAHAAGWTPERIDSLRRYWLEGLSSTQIAERLGGVTRSAVCGKIHRLGGAGWAVRPRAPAPSRPRPKRIACEAAKASLARPQLSCGAPTGRAAQHGRPAAPGERARHEAKGGKSGISPATLPDPGQCQWIDGDPKGAHSVCCAPTPARQDPWCAEHRARVYVPARGQG